GIILTSMMLISVHKRVSEIGIRRAFGAKRKDIFLQFLAEGVTICSIGIVIGVVVGVVVSYLVISKVLSGKFSIPIYGIIISSIFVFLVGILSSLYPAIRASKIPPAVAVKYE
ncbi:MAG: FtsX-like permease family protein, partial [bacterium]|nr:FtsX-like permease family protein [bacterium]